jgi:hypothetical protein
MPDAIRNRQRNLGPVAIRTPGAALVMAALLGGCAADNPMRGAFSDSFGQLFGGPSEAGFISLVDKNCGAKTIGGQSIATLLEADTSFRQLTSRLYRGDISKDTFTDMLLQEFPAADANIPATGCVANQLDACFNTRCDGRPAAPGNAIAAEQMASARELESNELPPADREAVEATVDEVGGAGFDDVAPLPGETTIDIAPETIQNIEDPTQP